ncbi:hypothetical protein ATANTOWER_028220, partial [Ataeniobius toweri]|nr:hypothetical protein [Ataeniobius toweri]
MCRGLGVCLFFACCFHYPTTRCRLSSGGEREQVLTISIRLEEYKSSPPALLRLSVCQLWLGFSPVSVQLIPRSSGKQLQAGSESIHPDPRCLPLLQAPSIHPWVQSSSSTCSHKLLIKINSLTFSQSPECSLHVGQV